MKVIFASLITLVVREEDLVSLSTSAGEIIFFFFNEIKYRSIKEIMKVHWSCEDETEIFVIVDLFGFGKKP